MVEPLYPEPIRRWGVRKTEIGGPSVVLSIHVFRWRARLRAWFVGGHVFREHHR